MAQFTKMELTQIAGFLRKVYPGQAEQDSLWGLIEKTEQLLRGNNGADNRRRGDRQ